MSRSAVLGSSLLVGAAVAFLIVRMVESPGAERSSVGTTESRAPEEPGAPDGPGVDLVAPASAAETGEPEGVEEAPEPAERAPDAQRSALRGERSTISGRVLGAGTLPAGETVTVRAKVSFGTAGRPGKPLELAAALAPDASFVLTLPAEAREASLDLDSRFLRAEPVRSLPGATDVVLEAETFAVLEGRVLPPVGSALVRGKADWSDIRVTFNVNSDVGPASVARAARPPPDGIVPEDDGSFAFVLVPVGVPLMLRAESPSALCRQRAERLQPGEKRVVELALEPSITVAGRVLDEHGAPVPDVRVATMRESVLMPEYRRREQTQTDADGRFSLAGLLREDLRLHVSGRGLARAAEVFVDGSAGDALDLILAVECGGCIEGTVEWPDGRPAERITVRVGGRMRNDPAQQEPGRFLACALIAGAYEVEVRASEGDVEGRARAEEVRPGDPPLRYVLEPERVYTVIGKVVDTEGKPLPTFQLTLLAPVPGREPRTHRGQNGGFYLDDLCAGPWTIRASANGKETAEQVVHAGPEIAEVRFTLRRAGRVRGRVLDAQGQPVDRAEVTLRGERTSFATTDADGGFDAAVPAPSFRVWAERTGHAPSEPFEITVGSGELFSDVIVRLRPSCRVEIRVVDDAGLPLAGALVQASVPGVEANKSDARGEAVLEDLPPGRIRVSAMLPDDRAEVSREIVLIEGRTATLELRLSPAGGGR